MKILKKKIKQLWIINLFDQVNFLVLSTYYLLIILKLKYIQLTGNFYKICSTFCKIISFMEMTTNNNNIKILTI